MAVRFRLYFKGSGLHCSQPQYFVHFVTQLLVFLSENRILVTQPQDFLLPQIYFLVEAFYHFVPNSDLLFLLVFLFDHHSQRPSVNEVNHARIVFFALRSYEQHSLKYVLHPFLLENFFEVLVQVSQTSVLVLYLCNSFVVVEHH